MCFCCDRSSTFFMFKIFHVYLFCGILFLLFSISMKIFEHELFFSSVNGRVYLERRTTRTISYFSKLSSLLLSGRPVQAKHWNFKEKPIMYLVLSPQWPIVLQAILQAILVIIYCHIVIVHHCIDIITCLLLHSKTFMATIPLSNIGLYLCIRLV